MPREISPEQKRQFKTAIEANLLDKPIGYIYDSLPGYRIAKRLTQDRKKIRYDVLKNPYLAEGGFAEVYEILLTFDEKIIPIEYSIDRVAKLHVKRTLRFDVEDKDENGVPYNLTSTEKQLIRAQNKNEAKEFINQEAEIAHQFDRRFRTQFWHSKQLYAYTIMSQVQGVDLELYIQANQGGAIFIENVLLRAIAMLLNLHALHSSGKVHYDVKPGNFVYDTTTYTGKWVDYGLSGLIGKKTLPAGTQYYCPPELAKQIIENATRNTEGKIEFNPALDIASAAGVILHMLNAQVDAFMAIKQIIYKRRNGYVNDIEQLFKDVVGPDRKPLSDVLKEKIKNYLVGDYSMSAVKPEQRPSALAATNFFMEILKKLAPKLYKEQIKNFQLQEFYDHTVLQWRMALRQAMRDLQGSIDVLSDEKYTDQGADKLVKLIAIKQVLVEQVQEINAGFVTKERHAEMVRNAKDFFKSSGAAKILSENRTRFLPNVFWKPASYAAYLESADWLRDWRELVPSNPIVCKV